MAGKDKTTGLSDVKRRFAEAYMLSLNATKAAAEIGFTDCEGASAKTRNPAKAGSRMLRDPAVAEYIDKLKAERSRRTAIDTDYVLTGIKDTIEKCLQAEPVCDKDGNPIGVYTFQANAAMKGFELLGKHLGTWKEKVEISGPGGGPVQVKADVTLSPAEAYEKMVRGS